MSDEKTEVVAVEETAGDAPAAAEAAPTTPETPENAAEAAPEAAEDTPETPENAAEAAPEAAAATPETPENAAEAAPEAAEATPEAAAAAVEAQATTTEEDDETPKKAPRPELHVVKMNLNLEDLPDDLSADDFESALERTVMEFREGSLVEGTVVRVDPDEVLIDIGFKSEGVIPTKELSIRNNI
ncbi:MAG: S1 RNA-binding domain-containing protein, partial [Acidimicrobiia bacterium]